MVLANDWASHEATLRSYELIARRVMPELRGHLAPLRASYDMVASNKRSYGGARRRRHPPGLRRRRRGGARRPLAWQAALMGELTEARTACRICAVGCGTIVELDGDRVVRINGDPDDPWSQGYTCSKGRAGPEFHHDPRRFDVPLDRAATASWSATTWDEALDDIAARLDGVVAEHGPAAVASYTGTGGPLDPSGYALAQGFFRALGTDRRCTARSASTARASSSCPS